MKIATSELELLREEVKNCHRIIKDLKKKREFVGLTDDECRLIYTSAMEAPVRDQVTVCKAIEAKLKDKNT